MLIELLSIFVIGLVFGSFLSALTYRLPRDESTSKGRSKCPDCNKKIEWYDNIPLFSYILLAGKCRNCGEKISLRYPLIEFSTGATFVATYYFYQNCMVGMMNGGVICNITSEIGLLTLPFLLTIATIMIAIFIIDLEHQIIPDRLTFVFLGLVFFMVALSPIEDFYLRMFIGFSASLFLLFLHMITKGKGMGLGDVKLAIPAGIFLGWPHTLVWLTLSFNVGAIVGIILIVLKKAKFGKQIAFGPFLVIAFFMMLFWGDYFVNLLLPFA